MDLSAEDGFISWKSPSQGSSSSQSQSSLQLPIVHPAPYSKPSVHLEPSKDLKPGDEAVVTCHASRGYPEASVLWQDSRGANLTQNVTTSQVANEEGLFEVRSVLRVLVEPSVTYSCLVLNAVLRQHGHASVTITGEQEVTLVAPAHRASLEGLGEVTLVAPAHRGSQEGLGEVAMVALAHRASQEPLGQVAVLALAHTVTLRIPVPYSHSMSVPHARTGVT